VFLRDYQEEDVTATLAALANGSKAALGVAATGLGKTVFAVHLAKRFPGEHRVFFGVHREELCRQTADKVEKIFGETPDVEMGELKASPSLYDRPRMLISSVQTMNAGPRCSACTCRNCKGAGGFELDRLVPMIATDSAEEKPDWLTCECCGGSGRMTKDCPDCIEGVVRRMQKFDPMDFTLAIIDEAHHAVSPTWRRMIRYFQQNPNLRVCGLTATPDRADEEALGKIFDSVTFERDILFGIDGGWLVPILQEYIECKNLDFSQCRTTAGDLNAGDLERVMMEERPLHQTITPMIEIVGNRPTLVFTTSVAHAERAAELINRHRPGLATCIHGGTPSEERRKLLAQFEHGKYQYLCGCNIFLEGFDSPRIAAVAMCRPTKSRALYAQAIGRGTRPISPPAGGTPEERRAEIDASAKRDLLVLDFVGNSGRHKLISSADILGGNFEDDVVERAVRRAQERGERGPVDMRQEIQGVIDDDLEEKRERERVKAQAKFTCKIVDPFDVFDLAPLREPPWLRGRKPSEAMTGILERAGIGTENLTYSQAKRLIGGVIDRRKKGLCTFRQARTLARHGLPMDVTFSVADEALGELSRNNWHVTDSLRERLCTAVVNQGAAS
jgi:superfamily II DNA or RNA helicase